MRPLAWLLARAHDEGEAARAAEIESELEHHLACARAELERAGHSPAAAAAEAERRFGARARIEAECLAVHRRIPMRNRVHAAVTAVLFFATVLLAFSLWRAREAADEARDVAMRAHAMAEATRARAIEASEIHPVWEAEASERRERLQRRLREFLEQETGAGGATLTPEESSLLQALGYGGREETQLEEPSEELPREDVERLLRFLERRDASLGPENRPITTFTTVFFGAM